MATVGHLGNHFLAFYVLSAWLDNEMAEANPIVINGSDLNYKGTPICQESHFHFGFEVIPILKARWP